MLSYPFVKMQFQEVTELVLGKKYKVIHHFPGGVGVFQHKIDMMKHFLLGIKESSITSIIVATKRYIDENLMPTIKDCNEKLEGNIFMLHHTTEYTNCFLNKIKNITSLLLNKNVKNVLEIGFNSGFSTLLMLLTNPHVQVTCLDLGEHKYTEPCYKILKETFGNRVNMIVGDSRQTMKTIVDTFDLIHIDGGHYVDVAESDIIHSYRISKNGTILIMNDYDFPHLHRLWDSYVVRCKLKPIDIYTYPSLHHDIKYVVNKID
jgi:predicted O-methyltransferase YrrM